MYSADKIWVAVDCLVFGYDPVEEKLKVLLFKRPIQPFAGDWSLIGDFVKQDEDTFQSALRTLKKFTGLEDVFLEQLHTSGRANRDPGGRVISILYWSLIQLDKAHQNTTSKMGAEWISIMDTPKLVIDHNQMLERGLKQLKQLAHTHPVGFELLPSEFTLPQLHKLYQSLVQYNIDDRNFRKKMLATGLLIKLDKKDKTTSRKGAFLYRFDQDRFKQLDIEGFYIQFLIKGKQDVGT